MERQLVEIFITHVEKEGPLLKLWAQTDRATPTFVERTINQLTEKFDLGIGIPDPSQLTVGQLCCAKYNDGIYYRARITSLANLAKGEVGVQFADYGNLEVITLNNLRSLEEALTPLSTIADQASDFYLAGVVPVTGDWSPQSLKFVKDLICYVELKCLFVGSTTPSVKHFIKLIYNEVDFASVLIERRIGVTILVDTQVSLLQSIMNKKSLPTAQMWPSYNPDVPPPLAMPQPLSHPQLSQPQLSHPQMMVNASMAKATDNMYLGMGQSTRPVAPPPTHLSHMSAHPGINMVSQIPPVRAIQQFNTYPPVPGHIQASNRMIVESPPLKRDHALNFESICLEVGSQYDVRVAYVDDGPFCFVVSLRSMETILGKMLTEINSVPPIPLSRPPMIGTTCLGRYTLDGSLCRAVVVTVTSDSCRLYYVDFGHSETLPYSELFDLPQHYVTYPKVMAIQVSHAGLTELNVNQEMKDIFKDYVVAKYFTLLVVPSESHRLKQYGILYEGGRGVLDIIQDQIEARKIHVYPIIPSPQVGSTKPILVSFVGGLDTFFVQLEDNTETLESVMSEILTHCEGTTSPKLRVAEIQEGLVCCAKFVEDEQWYRAQISRVTKEGIFVNYVDYGNTECVQLESLRKITPELIRKIHAQAIPCCLTKLHNMAKDDALIDRFSELTVDKTLIMQVIEHRPDGRPVVELHDLSVPNAPPVSVSAELQKLVKSGSMKPPMGTEKNVYKAPNGSSNEYRETKTYAESRSSDQNNYVGNNGDKYQRSGSRNEPVSDWRAKNIDSGDKGDRYGGNKGADERGRDRYGGNKGVDERGGDRHGGNKGADERGGDRYGGNRAKDGRGDAADKPAPGWGGKNNTWEGSNESKMCSTGFPQPKIPAGETKPAQLVFVENPEDFYIQLTPDTALNDIMADVAAKYEGGGGRTLRQVSVGTPCIAQFTEDEVWYRAVVQSVDDEYAKVQFVDYGNFDDVPLKCIKEITPDFLNFPIQGVRCSLASSLPKGSKWSDDEINDFTAVADGKPLEVKFISEKNGLYSVTVKDVKTGKIINESFGAPAQYVAARPAPKPVAAPLRPVAAPPKPVAEPPKIPVLSPRKPVIIQLFADPKARFASEQHEVESKASVCVCWFISPEQFYVQDLSKASLVERTMGDIQHAYKGVNPNVKSVAVTTPVIARYFGDNSLCRAEVKSNKDSNSHIIQYVDFGNCDLVKKSDMWQIEARFVEMPKQAILCSLMDIKPVDGTWPKDQPEADKLFQDEKYECTFYEQVEGKYYVNLTHNGASVSEEMVAKGLAAPLIDDEPEITSAGPCLEEPVGRAMMAGQTLHATVTYVEGVAKFFVHLEGNKSEEVQALVDAHVLVPENIQAFPADQIALDTLCIATADGAQWYRARIVDCSGTAGIYVSFIDYGDGDEVTADKMIPIPAELVAYPDQAVECGLSGCDAQDVKPEVEDAFKAAAEGEALIVHVDTVGDNCMNVTVYSLDGKKSEVVKDIGDGPPEVPVVCPLPILEQKPRVIVSHVDDVSSVWLQKVGEIDVLTDLLGRMYAHYEEASSVAAVDVCMGLICAAKSANDEQWYRARVTSVDDGVTVLYVDYGNSEKLEASKIKALDAAFNLPHAAAVQVSLPVLANADKEIDVAAMTADVEYVAAFSPNEAGKWWCELFNNKESLSEQLIEAGLELIEDYPFAEAVEELTRSPKMVTGMWVSVFVSHPENPRAFWVQRADNAGEIEKLQADLQAMAESLEVLATPTIGRWCAALFSEDGSWYRATVLEINDTAVTVRFVDYGNTDVVDVAANPLKILTPKMTKHEVYAMKCALNVSPVDGEFTAETNDRFAALVLESELPLNAVVITEGETTLVDLYMGEKSFFTTLIEENLAVEHCDENAAFVSHVNSLSEFWIQYQNVTKQLETMAEVLGKSGEFEPLVSDAEGTLCAAQFVDDEQWYRAKVTGNTDDGTVVHFVDYGNSAVATELRALPEALLEKPYLAKCCSLDTGDNAAEWSAEASEKFAEMVENVTVFKVEVLAEGDAAKVVLTENDVNIAVLLRAVEAKPIAVEESSETPTEIVADGKVEDDAKLISEESKPFVESDIPKGEVAILEGEVAIPEDEVAILEGEVAILEGEVAILEGEVAIPEDKVAIPEDKVAIPEDEVAIPEGEEAILEGEVLGSEAVGDLPTLQDEISLGEVESAQMYENKAKEAGSEDEFVEAQSVDEIATDGAIDAAVVDETRLNLSQKSPKEDVKPSSSDEMGNECDEETDSGEGKVVLNVLATSALEETVEKEDKSEKELGSEGKNEDKLDISGSVDEVKLIRSEKEKEMAVINREDKETKETLVASLKKERANEDTGSETSDDLNSSGNSQFLDATSDVDKAVNSPDDTVGEIGCPLTPRSTPAQPLRALTPREEKIVPGSISRGLSEEELQKYQFCPIADETEHSEELGTATTPSATPRLDDAADDKSRSYPSTPVKGVLQRAGSMEEDYVPSPIRLKHHERIVPGSISSGSSVDELRDLIENGIEIAEDTIADICDATRRDDDEKNLSSIDSAKELKDLSDVENGNNVPAVVINGLVPDVFSADSALLKEVDTPTKKEGETTKE